MTESLLYDMGGALLDEAVDCLTDASFEPPERRYVHVGNVAWDCPALIVQVSSLVPQAPPSQANAPPGMKQACAMYWTVKMAVVLLYCAEAVPPDGLEARPPSVKSLDADASRVLEQGWQLIRCLSWKWTHKQLLGNYVAACEQILWEQPEFVGPQGGIVGVSLPLTIDVAEDQYQYTT